MGDGDGVSERKTGGVDTVEVGAAIGVSAGILMQANKKISTKTMDHFLILLMMK